MFDRHYRNGAAVTIVKYKRDIWSLTHNYIAKKGHKSSVNAMRFHNWHKHRRHFEYKQVARYIYTYT